MANWAAKINTSQMPRMYRKQAKKKTKQSRNGLNSYYRKGLESGPPPPAIFFFSLPVNLEQFYEILVMQKQEKIHKNYEMKWLLCGIGHVLIGPLNFQSSVEEMGEKRGENTLRPCRLSCRDAIAGSNLITIDSLNLLLLFRGRFTAVIIYLRDCHFPASLLGRTATIVN